MNTETKEVKSYGRNHQEISAFLAKQTRQLMASGEASNLIEATRIAFQENYGLGEAYSGKPPPREYVPSAKYGGNVTDVSQIVADRVADVLEKKEAPDHFQAQALVFTRDPELGRAYIAND